MQWLPGAWPGMGYDGWVIPECLQLWTETLFLWGVSDTHQVALFVCDTTGMEIIVALLP